MIKYLSLNKCNDFLTITDFNEMRKIIFEVYRLSNTMHGGRIGLDLETNGLDPLVNKVLLTSIGVPEMQVVVDNTTISLKELLPEGYNQNLYVNHNIKFDWTMLITNFGIRLNKLFCTMIADQRLYQNSGFEMNLAACVLRHFGIQMAKDEQTSFVDQNPNTFRPNSSQIIYTAADTEHIIPLSLSQDTYLEEFGMKDFVHNTEFYDIKVIGQMELDGINIDDNKIIERAKQVELDLYVCRCELDNLLKKCRDEGMGNYKLLCSGKYNSVRNFIKTQVDKDMFGAIKYKSPPASKGSINWNSTDQIADVFARLEIEMTTKEGTAYVPVLDENNKLLKGFGYLDVGHGGKAKMPIPSFSTKEEIVEAYVISNPDSVSSKFLSLVNRHAKHLKDLSTYCYSLIDKKNPDTGKLHTIYRQASTNNARLSSGGGDKLPNKPNFQNFPRLKTFRSCIVADPGHLLQTVDLSGAEVTILCDKANDRKLYEYAVVRDDAHSPIVTNSWKHIFLYRAGVHAGKWSSHKDYYKNWRNYENGFNSNDPLVVNNYNLYKEFVVSKNTNVPYRQAGKNCTFGSIYGMKGKKAAETYNGTTGELRKVNPKAKAVNVTNDEGEIALWAIKEVIPDSFKFIENKVRDAFKNGYLILNERSNTRVWFKDVISILKAVDMTLKELEENGHNEAFRDDFPYGYGKYILTSGDEFKLPWNAVTEIDGQARNLTISGTQADMIKEAMMVIDVLKHKYSLPFDLRLQVHDELVYQIPENYCNSMIPTFDDQRTGISWNTNLSFDKFIPHCMTECANRYLTNVEMKAEGVIKPFWTK